MIFDGKAFAREIEQRVKEGVQKVGKKVKIVSVIVGDDPASILYTKLKKAAAERVGIEFEVRTIDASIKTEDLVDQISEIGGRVDVAGVMVQLPLPENFMGETLKVLEAIPLTKDVDGLRWKESGVMPATVKAVLTIVDAIAKDKTKFVVLGSRGAVGRPLVHHLLERGVNVSEVEWDTPRDEVMQKCASAQVCISCVGKPGVVTLDMVRDSMIVIDVGMSEVDGKVLGDMTQEVYARCSVVVPVPNGVGPVTIACLLQNALEMSEKLRTL